MSFLFGKTPQVTAPVITAPNINFSPVGASGGGLTTTIPSSGNINVTPDGTRTAAVGDVQNTYSGLADATAGLRSTVTPGYNDLLKSRLDQINDSARSAVGDLRQNLQSRRVLGSSFGQDTISRADAEFSRQRDDATASSFISSIDMSNKLLQQEYQARTSAAAAGLNELNLEATTANNLLGTTNELLANNARAQASLISSANSTNASNALSADTTNAKLEAESQSGLNKLTGNIFGQLTGPSLSGAGSAISGGLGSLFGGSAGASGMMAGLEALGPAAII